MLIQAAKETIYTTAMGDIGNKLPLM